MQPERQDIFAFPRPPLELPRLHLKMDSNCQNGGEERVFDQVSKTGEDSNTLPHIPGGVRLKTLVVPSCFFVDK